MSMENDFIPVKSVYNSNFDCIKNIMSLYGIERFDLDCTYSKGSFWKNLPEPIYKTDLYPSRPDIIQSNSENLPFENESMGYVMVDPPFIISGKSYKENKEGSSIIAKRFEGYPTYEQLIKNYFLTLKELYRICKKEGYVVMKCQDTVSGGKNHFSHCMIMNMAMDIGYYPRDLFILHNKVRLNSFGGRWSKQEHARKHHSYFWVFQKINPKVKYDYTKYINEQDSVENQDTFEHGPQL
jgi:hypothetical protein